jgi:hypothetical protein
MRKFCIPAIAAATLFALPALAATTTTTTNAANPAPEDTTSIQQQLRQDLSKIGYTDIKITPGSFLVQAKDKHGNPTEMMISPHSMTEVTALGAPGNATQSGKSESGSPSVPTKK